MHNKVDNTLLDLFNSSYPAKAEFINCEILNLAFVSSEELWTSQRV